MTRISLHLVRILAVAACFLSAPAAAEKVDPARTVQQSGDLKIEIVDLTPRFLTFHRAASGANDPESRFALWKTHYGFGAFPPGPEGDKIARELLDSAWPRYSGDLARLKRGADLFGQEPIDTLRKVARLLEADGPLPIRFVAYVGGYENNAFAARADGPPIVNFPVEMPAEQRRLVLPHEMTHAVHMHLANLSGGWERSIAATLLQEGLAMHVTRELVPGMPLSAYIEHEAGWWEKAGARRAAILRGIKPALEAKDSDTVFRFTMGQGPAGIQREAYAAGWWVIERLRRDGMSLAQIARVPEEQMPELAMRAIERVLAD